MRTVLLVDDNPLAHELLGQLLEERYEVRSAYDGAAGLASARAQLPDAVLMDLTMPVMDGWTAIRALRAEWSTCRVPIIALSAISDDREIRRAMEAGADLHLPKPLDEDELLSALERFTSDAGKALSQPSGVRRRAGVLDAIRRASSSSTSDD